MKRHECGNRITRQSEDCASIGASEKEWLAGLYRHAPEIGLRADGIQGRSHQIARTYRDTTQKNQNFELNPVAERALDRVQLIRTVPDVGNPRSALRDESLQEN